MVFDFFYSSENKHTKNQLDLSCEENTTDLDLHIVHERWGSRSNPSLDGRLYYPTDLNRPLNEDATDKNLQYRVDYNNRPSNSISFTSSIGSVSGRLHCDFVLLLFSLTHRETGRFFARFRSSGSSVSLPSIGVLLTDQIESGTHPCQGWSHTY